MSLCCGAAVRDITPPLGLPMGGYAARAGVAAGVRDPLLCRVLVLGAGESTAAFVLLDLVYVSRPWTDKVRAAVAARLDCAPAQVLVAATHTHAGPAVFRSVLTDDARVAAYEDAVADMVVATVEAAQHTASPATLAYGSATAPAVAANRRSADGPFDATVRALVFRHTNAAPLAVVATFGCHPTVLPPANLRYSADLFGAASAVAATALGAPVLLFNGAAADVSTRFTRRSQDDVEVERLGTILGEAIVAAVRSATPIAGAAPAGIDRRVAIELVRAPAVEEARATAAAAAARAEACRAGSLAVRRVAAAEMEGAAAQLFFALHGGIEGVLGRRPETAVVQRLRLGGIDIIAVPGEVFAAAGHAVSATATRPTLLVGYANDYLGYLVSPDVAAAGGYEALVAFLTPTSAAAIMAAATELTAA